LETRHETMMFLLIHEFLFKQATIALAQLWLVLFIFRKNINCNVMESLERFREVMNAAKKANIRVRGYAVVCKVFLCYYYIILHYCIINFIIML